MAVNPTVFGFVRSIDGENPVIVVINLGARNILSARSMLKVDEFPPNARGRVLAATSTSNYREGDFLNVNQYELQEYDAIAFVVESESSATSTTTPTPEPTTPDSASTVVATFLIMIMSVLVVLL